MKTPHPADAGYKEAEPSVYRTIGEGGFDLGSSAERYTPQLTCAI